MFSSDSCSFKKFARRHQVRSAILIQNLRYPCDIVILKYQLGVSKQASLRRYDHNAPVKRK